MATFPKLTGKGRHPKMASGKQKTMKNIILAVTGLSPQVITETLYALHQGGREVHAIHVVTTREGKDRIFADLLAGKDGRYHRYLNEYGIDPDTIAFDHSHVHTVTDPHGVECADILTEADNERLLALCLALAFELTKDPDTAVFFSIAGGRKTMSACLTLAAQFYGRPQDRLYHVLVSPDFEGSREFFYPPKESKTITLKARNGQAYYKDTRYAEINLISVPFVSIRDSLSKDALKAPKPPGALLLSLIREETLRLTVNLVDKKIIYKRMELDLTPAQMALYAFFAMRKKDCRKNSIACGDCHECFLDLPAILNQGLVIADIYKRVCGTRPVEEMSKTGIMNLDAERFNSLKSKIKAALQNRFGPYALKELEIASKGRRPDTRYGILMDKGKIEIVY